MLRKESVTSVCAQLKDCAQVYCEILNPQSTNPSSEILNDLKDLNQEQVYVPLLAAGLRFGASSDEFKAVADAVLVFIVRFQVCLQSSNTLDKVFADACEHIKNEGHSCDEIVSFFRNRQREDSEFEAFFKSLTFDYSAGPQKKARVYLKRIEQKERGANQPLKYDRKRLTAEHIIPKQPELNELRNWIGSDVDSSDFSMDDFTDQTIKSIGKLVLLFQPENSSAGNRSYADKREVYSNPMKGKDGENRGIPKDVFPLIAELLDDYRDSFNQYSVEDRAIKLANKAKIYWR